RLERRSTWAHPDSYCQMQVLGNDLKTSVKELPGTLCDYVHQQAHFMTQHSYHPPSSTSGLENHVLIVSKPSVSGQSPPNQTLEGPVATRSHGDDAAVAVRCGIGAYLTGNLRQMKGG
ncbi:hypothetical protein BaRGS_00007144, partial [Batillaria attramentaria]